MNIVNLCFYADGYYSGNTYEENIAISEDFYKKIKNKVSDMEVYISELDGKHSEVLGEIDIQYCEEKDIPDWYTESKRDGEIFFERLNEVCNYLELNLSEEIKDVEDFINTLDYNIEITVSVKKSKRKQLLEYVKKLSNQ